jgi:hypothetical protein
MWGGSDGWGVEGIPSQIPQPEHFAAFNLTTILSALIATSSSGGTYFCL